MGKDAVESVLRERQKELLEKYSIRMKDMKFNEKVKELARIRDEEGYIAESKKDRKRNSHTLLRYKLSNNNDSRKALGGLLH